MSPTPAATSNDPRALALEVSVESLAEALPIPVFLTNEAGVVVSVNSNARFLFDFHQPLTTSTTLEMLAGDRSGPFRRALVETLDHGSSLLPELPPVHRALEDMRFLLSTSLMTAGDETLVLFSMREVTSGLELTRLKAKDELQDYMFRALVHDLRTPLSAISSGTQFLESEIPNVEGQAGQDIREVLGVLQYSCNQVEGLLQDLGELVEYHINPSGTSIDVLDLEDVLQDILDVYRIRGLPHEFRFEMNGPASIHGVHQRFTRALDNLISNAVKYSPEGGPIAVSVGDDAADANRVMISIADSGIGMDPEQLQRIWEPFYRLHNEDTAEIEGTGLGLSIVRFVIENHGGTIEVESERGKGTTFHVSLPRGH